MDILKRELAPIPAEAWAEIDQQAIRSLTAILSARKVIDVTGPMGTDFPGVPEGRWNFPKSSPKMPSPMAFIRFIIWSKREYHLNST